MNTLQRKEQLRVLKDRFEHNIDRHPSLRWAEVEAKLEASPKKLTLLHGMEITGGEPDVIAHEEQTGTFTFCDCAAQTPAGRRSV